MNKNHLMLGFLIAISILHVVSDGEATVKLLKQWK